MAKPGVKLSEIEKEAQFLIKAVGGKPSFATVPGYFWATCINLNEGLVHGVPDETAIKDGDIVSIDVGIYYQGYHTDTSISFIAGSGHYPAHEKFLAAGKEALKKGIAAATVGNRIGHISLAIEEVVKTAGYSPALNLTGHGVGRQLHEEPTIPCFVAKPISQTPPIKPGMTLAVEAIYLAGRPETVTDPDDHWTISSKDGKITAVFEETILTTPKTPVILTNVWYNTPLMSQADAIEVDGVVLEALPNTTFKVKLDNSDKIILCHLAGKMRLYRIRVLPGDKVKVELTPYDEARGRIVYRET